MHTRIRKFNTRDTYPEQKLDNDLCQTVVARGSMVFVRGQVGQDLDTAVNVGIGDAAAQAEQAMQNIEKLLGEAGAKLEHICKITIYLTDPRFREAVYRNFDWEGPLQFVRKAADLSERVMPKTDRAPGDKAIQQWYSGAGK